ncbi:MAG: hypothetical protein Q8S73_05200 [Deltaproteobacteria bacterium]|nr:hypothetical protein [Deltaproteobacteria bacterium]
MSALRQRAGGYLRAALRGVVLLAAVAAATAAAAQASRASGWLVFGFLELEERSELAWRAARLLGWLLLASGAVLAAYRSRAPAALRRLAFALAAAGAFAAYLGTIRPSQLPHFHGVRTMFPSRRWEDRNPNRPAQTYRMNRFGFRGDEWEERKPAGVFRVALVGDSFVFGMGVSDEETLGARLAQGLPSLPDGRRVEVLNLGVPGSNLSTHARMIEVAHADLSADMAVLVYHVPNDFTDWDNQDEIQALERVSLFGFMNFALGPEPAAALTTRLFVDGGGLSPLPAAGPQLAALDRELRRLDAARRRWGSPPLVVLPIEYVPLPGARERFAAQPNVAVARRFGNQEEFQIPVDGHPNAAGQRAYAAAVLEAMRGLDPLRALSATPR